MARPKGSVLRMLLAPAVMHPPGGGLVAAEVDLPQAPRCRRLPHESGARIAARSVRVELVQDGKVVVIDLA